ncbi:hypothetical protein N6L24_09285 [Cognatishimia sp. SS12]|uniref:hypothetical protein n=1 Tax=Cognatishimia sp. SS12 TaxID=2979465 RepID=UPI002330A252|nr:hypothetical protein [Cognatishimia sp. SS12]MDC0738474.1 hypothetical protein [Cognatishimia sp. SS12]
MFGLMRLLVIGFLVLTVVYFCLLLYSRAVRREKLEADWEAGNQELDRDNFVRTGLEDYDHSLRRKLIWGVYVVPTGLMILIIYLTNFH